MITLSITLFVVCCVIALWIWLKTPPENPSGWSTPKDFSSSQANNSSALKPFDSSSMKPNDTSGVLNPTGQFTWLPRLLSALFGKSNVHTKIVINGQEFSNPDQMPPEARRVYDETMRGVLSDTNHNGIPDLFEGGGSKSAFHVEMKNLSSEVPAEKLKQLKEMRDSGLITEQEYETKKAEILARM